MIAVTLGVVGFILFFPDKSRRNLNNILDRIRPDEHEELARIKERMYQEYFTPPASDIARWGEKAVPMLVDVLNEGDFSFQNWIGSWLSIFTSSDVAFEFFPVMTERSQRILAARIIAAKWLGELEDNAWPAAQSLVRILEGPEHPTLKVPSAIALGRIGKKSEAAVSPLLKFFDEDEPTTTDNHQARSIAAFTLGEIGARPEDVLPVLERHMNDPFPSVRQPALSGLGGFGEASLPYLPKLLAAWEQEDYSAQSGAILGILKMGGAARTEIDRLFRDPRRKIRQGLVGAVGSTVGPPQENWSLSGYGGERIYLRARIDPQLSAQILLDALLDTSAQVREIAMKSLPYSSVPPVSRLSEMLRHRDVDVRARAVGVLSRMGPPAAAAQSALTEALKDESAHIRLSAAEALVNAGLEPVEAVDALAALAVYPDCQTRIDAIRILGRCQAHPDRVIPALMAVRQFDEDGINNDLVWRQLAHAYERLGDTAMPTLRRMLKSSPDSKVAALRVMSAVGVPAILDYVEILKTSHDPKVLEAALYGVTGRPDQSETVAPGIRRLLQFQDKNVRFLALNYVHGTGQSAIFVPWVVEALEDRDADIRREAANTLGNIYRRPELAVPALIRRMEDPAPPVRRVAIISLGRYGEGAASAVPALTDALKSKDRDIRYFAIVALGNIGRPSQSAVPALQALHESERRTTGNHDVLRQIGASLKQITGRSN